MQSHYFILSQWFAMGDRPSKSIQGMKDAIDRTLVAERPTKIVVIGTNNFPELAKGRVVDHIWRSRRNTRLHLALAVLKAVLDDIGWNNFPTIPPVCTKSFCKTLVN